MVVVSLLYDSFLVFWNNTVVFYWAICTWLNKDPHIYSSSFCIVIKQTKMSEKEVKEFVRTRFTGVAVSVSNLQETLVREYGKKYEQPESVRKILRDMFRPITMRGQPRFELI